MKTNITYVVLIGFHILLGTLVFTFPFLSKVYFFSALAYFFWRIITLPSKQKTVEILKAGAYFIGIEVFFRMTHGAISYEASKYLVIIFMLLGMFYRGLSGKGYPYFIYLMLLIPSIFVASTTLSFDANFRTNIAFVLSGPVCLGFAALFCYNRRVTQKELSDILLYIGLPVISLTTYLFLYTPSIRDALSGTASNGATSGGFGPNQVATVLGLGMFVFAVRFFMNSSNITFKILNAFLFGLISFRAIVTFSRGGVITAVICIAAFLLNYYLNSKSRKRNQIIGAFLLFLVCMSVVWIVSSNQTLGLIDKRYANQNAAGVEKEDISTGRYELFMHEIEGFVTNPFFGIGSSRAKDQRIEEEGQGITSHNEISRTLAEHGIFGVIILIILLFKPLDIRSNNKQNYYFYAFLAFWFATINHSSMRIAAPAFIYGLALLNVTHEKRPVHRKQLKATTR